MENGFKVTDKNESNDLQFNVKKTSAGQLADREALKKQAGAAHRTFDSDDDLIKSAESIIGAAKDKYLAIYEKEKELGFDVNDEESVKNFVINYTPLGNTLLVKFIHEEQKIGSIIVPDASALGRKAIVMEAGLFVNVLKRGDIVSLFQIQTRTGKIDSNALPPSATRIFNNITFDEISYESVAGVFKSRDEINARLKQND